MASLNMKKMFSGMLLGVCCTCGVYAANDLIPALMEQGMKNYTNKDYAAAADYLGQVVDMDAEHSQARYYLTYSLALSGDNEKALKHAQILANKFPNEPQYQTLVNQIKAELERQYQKKKHPEAASGKIQKEVMLGGYKSLDKNAELQKPKEDYTPREITPPRPLTELEKAIRKIDEEQYDVAEKMLKDITAKEPKNAKAFHNLGVIEFSKNNFKGAVDYLSKACDLDSKSFESIFLLADAYRNIGDLANAEKSYKKAVDIKKDEFAMGNLANIYIEQGKTKEAAKIYKEIIKKSPKSVEAVVGLAQIKLSEGKSQEALQMVNDSLGKVSDANYIRALVFLENEMNDEALEEIGKAYSSNPGNQRYLQVRALTNVRCMNFTQGMDDANTLLRLNSDNVNARLVMAEGLMATGNDDDAETQLTEIEKHGQIPESCRLRAMLARKQGNKDVAKQQYEKYIELSNGSPKAAYEFAEFLAAEDMKDEAVLYYKEILNKYKDTDYAAKAREGLSRTTGEPVQEAPAAPNEESSDEDSSVRPGKVRF